MSYVRMTIKTSGIYEYFTLTYDTEHIMMRSDTGGGRDPFSTLFLGNSLTEAVLFMMSVDDDDDVIHDADRYWRRKGWYRISMSIFCSLDADDGDTDGVVLLMMMMFV